MHISMQITAFTVVSCARCLVLPCDLMKYNSGSGCVLSPSHLTLLVSFVSPAAPC